MSLNIFVYYNIWYHSVFKKPSEFPCVGHVLVSQ